MVSSKQLHRMLTKPHEYMRFLTTGKAPQATRPDSPLIRVLEAVAPQDLLAIRGLTIDSRLGYSGLHTFHTAALALQWLKPSSEVFGTYPAGSWQDKRYRKQLQLADVLECASGYPEGLAARYPRLG